MIKSTLCNIYEHKPSQYLSSVCDDIEQVEYAYWTRGNTSKRSYQSVDSTREINSVHEVTAKNDIARKQSSKRRTLNQPAHDKHNRHYLQHENC